MKKLITLLLLAVVLGGCGNGNNGANESAEVASPAASGAAAETQVAESPAAETPASESPSAEDAASEEPASLDDLIQVFTDAGIEVDPNEKPIFQMIGAQNGVLFYIDNKVVKIYEYKDSDALEAAVKQFEMAKDWPVNGRFLLETSSEQAIELFAGAK